MVISNKYTYPSNIILDSYNREVEDPQIQPTITSKEAKLDWKHYVNILNAMKVWKD